MMPTNAKTAVVPPIPRIRVQRAETVSPGDRQNPRAAYRMSCTKSATRGTEPPQVRLTIPSDLTPANGEWDRRWGLWVDRPTFACRDLGALSEGGPYTPPTS